MFDYKKSSRHEIVPFFRNGQYLNFFNVRKTTTQYRNVFSCNTESHVPSTLVSPRMSVSVTSVSTTSGSSTSVSTTPVATMQNRCCFEECPHCANELQKNIKLSIAVCSNCGFFKKYFDTSFNSIDYNEDIDFTSFSYRRINHFCEWLNVSQGKEIGRAHV